MSRFGGSRSTALAVLCVFFVSSCSLSQTDSNSAADTESPATAAGLSSDESSLSVVFDEARLFAEAPRRVTTIRKVGCHTEDVVDLYLATVTARNAEFVEALASANPDEVVELRLSLIGLTPFADVAPVSDVRLIGLGAAIENLSGSELDSTPKWVAIQATGSDADPVAEVDEKIADLVLEAEQRVLDQEKNLQDAVDAGNQFMIDRRTEVLKKRVSERDQLDALRTGSQSDGPMVTNLQMLGTPPQLANYLNGLEDGLVYDAIVRSRADDPEQPETDASTVNPLILTTWQAFSSVSALQNQFARATMLPMVSQIEVMDATRACPVE